MDRRPERENGISILEGNEKDLYRNFIKNRVSESWIAGDIIITVYKNKDDIPQDMEFNDIFFNQNTRINSLVERYQQNILQAQIMMM